MAKRTTTSSVSTFGGHNLPLSPQKKVNCPFVVSKFGCFHFALSFLVLFVALYFNTALTSVNRLNPFFPQSKNKTGL